MTLIADEKCRNCPGNILYTLGSEENKWISKHSFFKPPFGKDCILRLESGRICRGYFDPDGEWWEFDGFVKWFDGVGTSYINIHDDTVEYWMLMPNVK